MRQAPQSSFGAPPKAYVAGLGRGANAFTTTAAHGTVSVPASFSFNAFDPGVAPKGYVPGSGRGSGGFGDTKPQTGPSSSVPGGLQTSEVGGHFDPMLGYQGGSSLFSSGEYGSEDQYADAVYDSVDAMRAKKKPTSAHNTQTTNTGIKSIADDFADLKPSLKSISAEEWSALPDASTSLRTKKKKTSSKFTPVTDSLLASVAERAMDKRTDLSGLSQARDHMLRVNLDQADSISGATNVDPRGFLTELTGQLDAHSQLSDVKKARLLLKSVTRTNPVHGPGWIAAARVEEFAGNIQQAREIMLEAISHCPEEDVFLEAARLEPSKQEAKAVLIKALSRYLPKSVNLWLAVADLEITMEEAVGLVRPFPIGSWRRKQDLLPSFPPSAEANKELLVKRKELISQGLSRISDSSKLWTNAIAMETNDEEARQLVLSAQEHCPDYCDFYLCGARLEESFAVAQRKINEARKKFPGEVRIWVAAARLVEEQEQHGKEAIFQLLVQAVKKIAAHVDRTRWLKLAEEAEFEAYPITCEGILRATLSRNVDVEDRFRTWEADALDFQNRGHFLCAKVCLELLIETFPDSQEAWLKRLNWNSQKEALPVLQRAVKTLPQVQLFWLMLAKEMWKQSDVIKARMVLDEAFEQIKPGGEELWFAAAKLANEISPAEALQVWTRAREKCGHSERVWIKSVAFHRSCGQVQLEESVCRQALERFPRSEKLHLMLHQVLEYTNQDVLAKQVLESGLKVCPKSVPLWLALAKQEKEVVKNRAILDHARSLLHSPELWLASIRLERRANSPESIVQNYVARALQQFPLDGSLFAEQIELAPETKKESLAELAFKKTQGKDVQVVLACARLWWRKRPLDQAKVRKWLERAVSLNPQFGDAWGSYFRFLGFVGDEEGQIQTIRRCVEASPNRGELWIRVSKGRGNELLTVEQILKLVSFQSGPDDGFQG